MTIPSEEERADVRRRVEEFKRRAAAIPPEERRIFRPTSLNDLHDRMVAARGGEARTEDLDAVAFPRPAPRPVPAEARALSADLAAMPAHVAIVHRGVRITQEQWESYRPGTTITERGFTSTTSAVRNSFGGDIDLLIASRTGKAIRQYSARPEEDEVLFDHGTSFDVLAVGSDAATGRGVVVLREAGSPDSTDAVMAAAERFLRDRAAVPEGERRKLDYARFTPALGADPTGRIRSSPTPGGDQTP